MRIVRSASIIGLLIAGLGLPLVVAGCSGDGGGGGPDEFLVTITNCDAVTYAADGIVCIDFTLTGPAGTIDLIAEFIGGAAGPVEGAYEIPAALASQLGLTSDVTSLILSFDGEMISGRFYWFAGADLGFVAALGVQFSLMPVMPGTTTQVGPISTCGGINYLGGGMTETATGPSIPGRAAHCAEHVGGKSVAVAGGVASVMVFHDTFERFTIDPNTFTYSKNVSPLLMQDPRANHACSFFLDPVTGAIKVLATGGESGGPSGPATADVYCFSPTESVAPTMGNLNTGRTHHTATWVPSNKVVIIGGYGASGALCSIEVYDPVTDDFQLLTSALSFCRGAHTATLLPSGKILVAGGYDGANPNTPLPAEIFDPVTFGIMTVTGPNVDRYEHTATRLANGWVLLAGGLTVSGGTVSSDAQIFEPELGGMGQFTTTVPMMTSPRAYHAASRLGDGHVLLTGGEDGSSPPSVTQSAELFLYNTLTFTPVIPMVQPRAEHTTTATDCGTVVVVGGRNDVGGMTNFLGSLELYPFENTNPTVATAFTGTTGITGTVYVLITVEDADADGGYVIIRYRPGGVGMFRLCTIDSQSPSTAPGNFPNMYVFGMPGMPQPYSFRWNFVADGLASGQVAEIEVLPVGATLGTPVRFTFMLP
jgi:hypothetical protein